MNDQDVGDTTWDTISRLWHRYFSENLTGYVQNSTMPELSVDDLLRIDRPVVA
jgi:hypothetical protein